MNGVLFFVVILLVVLGIFVMRIRHRRLKDIETPESLDEIMDDMQGEEKPPEEEVPKP